MATQWNKPGRGSVDGATGSPPRYSSALGYRGRRCRRLNHCVLGGDGGVSLGDVTSIGSGNNPDAIATIRLVRSSPYSHG